MYTAACILLVSISFAFAGPSFRVKRQATNCDGPVENPCTTTLGQVYYPHPRDNNKFLQCSSGGRMFVITCPVEEVYNQATTACRRQQVVSPVVTNNPCTAANMASGNIFFPYTADQAKFIECSARGQPQLLDCPTRLVYSQARQSCILPPGTSTGTTGTGTSTGITIGTGTSSNPCNGQSIITGHLFFPHTDATKFIQCDMVGNAYVMQCPSGLVWNRLATNCASPYQATGFLTG